MRVASKIVTSLGSLAILGLGWQAGVAGTATTTSTSATSASGTASSGTSSSGTSSSGTSSAGTSSGTTGSTGSTGSNSSSGATTTSSGATDGSYTGSDVSTEFGNVQVQVVVSGGRITDVVALHLTDAERRSVQISAHAEPILKSEVLASQNAKISSVSGATYTSDAYIQSLQSALDQAGF